jgi:hypothetical protein
MWTKWSWLNAAAMYNSLQVGAPYQALQSAAETEI